MKKLITIILILALILPAAALAADHSPVGVWYMCYSKAATPEFASNFGEENDYALEILFLTEDGTVLKLVHDVAGKTGNPSFGAAGKWEKTSDGFTFAIAGFGSGKMKVEENNIYLQISEHNYLKLRKMYFYDPYKDFEMDPMFQ